MYEYVGIVEKIFSIQSFIKRSHEIGKVKERHCFLLDLCITCKEEFCPVLLSYRSFYIFLL